MALKWISLNQKPQIELFLCIFRLEYTALTADSTEMFHCGFPTANASVWASHSPSGGIYGIVFEKRREMVFHLCVYCDTPNYAHNRRYLFEMVLMQVVFLENIVDIWVEEKWGMFVWAWAGERNIPHRYFY